MVAASEGCTHISWKTAAGGDIVDNLAASIATARTGGAQFLCKKIVLAQRRFKREHQVTKQTLTWIERPTRGEWIARVPGRAGADRYMVPRGTLGIDSALPFADVNAPVVPADSASGTVMSLCRRYTICLCRRYLTMLIISENEITCTFAPLAVAQRVTPVSWKADTHGSALSGDALCV